MASGLVVVAPWEGGPATYVEDGVTGVLADTRSPTALAAAVAAAFDLAAAPGARRRGRGLPSALRQGWPRLQRPHHGRRPRRRSTRRRPRDAPGDQPGLRVSPLPLATLATAWQQAGERVVVATGSATDEIVAGSASSGSICSWVEGPTRASSGPRTSPAARTTRFVASSPPPGAERSRRCLPGSGSRRRPALGAAARSRRRWPHVVDRVRPDHVIVDHLAFSARLALTSAGVRHADVVLGHPSALTVGDEVYGYPPAWPPALHAPDPDALDRPAPPVRRVRDAFTARWNAALHALDPSAAAARRVRRER